MSTNFSNRSIFEYVKSEYQMTLKKSANFDLKNCTISKKETEKLRLFSSLPFQYNIKRTTKDGSIFFKLIDKHFPDTNKFYTIVNGGLIKLSCCCMDNIIHLIKTI